MYCLLQVFQVLLPYFPLVLLLSLQAEEETAPGLKASGSQSLLRQGLLSSPSTALNHFPAASAEEIPIIAALLSAKGTLATVSVLQNLRKKVAAVSLPK